MLTLIDASGNTFPLETDPTIEVENLKVILEMDMGIPSESQCIQHQGQELSDPKRTVASYGVEDNALLVITDKRAARTQAPAPQSQESGETQAAEMLRQQILGNSQMQQQLRARNPVLADAAQVSSNRFLEVLQQQKSQMESMMARNDLLESDPFDIDAQRRIEEVIREEQVAENLHHAIEYSPESFANVTMLYVNLKVNGHPVKAFVDSGAQTTILSPDCAERCGIMRLLDKRFSGVAKGVGTAKILGRIHSAQIQLGDDLFLPCSFTVLEGRDVDMLFGLDMLKRYQASIDLAKNALVINGRQVRFLDEHELPENARLHGPGPSQE